MCMVNFNIKIQKQLHGMELKEPDGCVILIIIFVKRGMRYDSGYWTAYLS